MTQAALQDFQWLNCLPQTLDFNLEDYMPSSEGITLEWVSNDRPFTQTDHDD